jgi:hypothetical protein
MSLIKVFLPFFRSLVKDSKFKDSQEGNLHPVFYYNSPDGVYFYKPVGSFVYKVELDVNNLPENIIIEDLINELGAIEIPSPMYHYRLELTGRQFV